VATEVTDNPDENRFEIRADGELAGFAAYERSPGTISFRHTEIDDRFGGKGLGSELARNALDAVRAEGLAVLPFCPFISGWIRKHPEYLDLVPEDQHERFGL
jgi:predicted GNAT family acetyltransferase